MSTRFRRSQLALAAIAATGAAAIVAPQAVVAQGSPLGVGNYLAGDIHNHTTCSDGATSMVNTIKKATDRNTTPWGLDWFAQAGHGGNGNRNCTLVEDASLATPAYPLRYAPDGVTLQGPRTTWQNTNPPVQPKGTVSGSAPNQNMWRWQSVQEIQYPLAEYLNSYYDKPIFMGIETVVPGGEHTSASVITGQVPKKINGQTLPSQPPYVKVGSADALAQWEYCFDRSDTDLSRGNTVEGGTVGNNWDCSVPGSLNENDPNWHAAAHKLNNNNGLAGHAKTVEAIKWMKAFHAQDSYYLPTHLERAGPFNPNGSNGFNIEQLRNFNNASADVAFGFETQPGHHASSYRGEYSPNRNNIGGVPIDSVGTTTWGGTGVYGAQIGGVWDALLGEGRRYWFFASSDWHNRGMFSADANATLFAADNDRRSTQDFYPGEYQRTYVLAYRENAKAKVTPEAVVSAMRSGNVFTSMGQLVDRVAFVACTSYAGPARRTAAQVEDIAVRAAQGNIAPAAAGCATMGQKLAVRPGADIVVAVVVRDPAGANFSPYSFANPSLAQVGIGQPLDHPVLDHVDVISGLVSGFKDPKDPTYSGTWPDNWADNPDMNLVPAGAKNTSAALIKTWNASSWTPVAGDTEFKKMSFTIPHVSATQYIRLRGSNLPAGVPYETDADGNPLADLWTDAGDTSKLRIPCNVVGTNIPANNVVYTGTGIDGCPNHLPVVSGQKMVAYDIAAWSDLWFYANPIYIQVDGGVTVAGVQ